jgi:hypothetical protein
MDAGFLSFIYRLQLAYWMALLRSVSVRRFSSAGGSFGRSMLSVSVLILPVNVNGTW